MGFSPEECRSAAIAMAVALPAREIDEKCESLYGEDWQGGLDPSAGASDAAPNVGGEIYPSREGSRPSPTNHP